MARIGFLIPEFPGQTQAFFIRERNELKKLGVDTAIISTRPPTPGISDAKHDWVQEATKETFYLTPLGLGGLLRCLLEILMSGPFAWLRILKMAVSANDLGVKGKVVLLVMSVVAAQLKMYCRREGLAHVHVHSCANAANLALIAKLLGGPRYSITLHGPLIDYGPNQNNKFAHAAFAIVITKDLYKEVHDVLDSDRLPEIYVAPMGVVLEDFTRKKKYEFHQVGEVIRLVTCGRLNYVKAHDDLIRAVALLEERGRRVQLNICGTTDASEEGNEYLASLKALPAELGVEDSVNFLGSVREQAVRQELESAHAFCLASLKEPLGVVNMEAMAMGTPAIVVRSPGVVEMIEDGEEGILVDPRSPKQFADAIEKLVDTPAMVERLTDAARKKVEAKYHSGVSASMIAKGITL